MCSAKVREIEAKPVKIRILFFLASISLLLAGCATPIAPQGMQAQSLTVQNRHPFSVSVQTTGGQPTNPLWVSKISSESFAEAIRDSISDSGLFRSVITTGDGDYSLDADIVSMSPPDAGFNMTANMTVSWKLTRVADKKIVFQDEISSSHTATMGDAFVGEVRWRLAEEGVAKANIEEGLSRISRLTLEGNETKPEATIPALPAPVENPQQGTANEAVGTASGSAAPNPPSAGQDANSTYTLLPSTSSTTNPATGGDR